jgi:starch phosphorylase
MTAAMNGGVNFSTNDGWVVEFVNHGVNGYVVPPVDYENMNVQDQDQYDLDQIYDILENEILPTYYDNPQGWRDIVKNGMKDVRFAFNSNRMADQYYELMYNAK